MKRGMWAVGLVTMVAGWGIMSASEPGSPTNAPRQVAQADSGAEPKADAGAAKSKKNADCINCAKTSKASLETDSVHFCPVFPLYEVEPGVDLWYCDVSGDGNCEMQSSDCVVRSFTYWPWEFCPDHCDPPTMFRGAGDEKFKGYPDEQRWTIESSFTRSTALKRRYDFTYKNKDNRFEIAKYTTMSGNVIPFKLATVNPKPGYNRPKKNYGLGWETDLGTDPTLYQEVEFEGWKEDADHPGLLRAKRKDDGRMYVFMKWGG